MPILGLDDLPHNAVDAGVDQKEVGNDSVPDPIPGGPGGVVRRVFRPFQFVPLGIFLDIHSLPEPERADARIVKVRDGPNISSSHGAHNILFQTVVKVVSQDDRNIPGYRRMLDEMPVSLVSPEFLPGSPGPGGICHMVRKQINLLLFTNFSHQSQRLVREPARVVMHMDYVMNASRNLIQKV